MSGFSASRFSHMIRARLFLSAVFLVLIFLPGTSPGYGFHDALNYGNSIDVISVRSAALVGIRVFGADGGSALFLNPASLSVVNRFSATSSLSYLAWSEEVVEDNGKIQRSDTGFGSFTGALAYRAGSDIVLGAGIAKVSDHQYEGTHYLPENPSYPGIDIVEVLKSSGGLWEALGGASWSITDKFTAGVSAGLRFGEVSYEYSLDKKFTPEPDSTSSWSWDISEACYHAGIILGDDDMSAGLTYTSAATDHYYSRISVAGRVSAEHIGGTIMGFEGEIIDPFNHNFFNGKLSIETPIRSNMNLLLGVGFNEGENMNRVGLAFSIGGNYSIGPLRVDFAMYNSGRSRKSMSFPGEEYSDYVDDSWSHFCLGLQYMI